MKIKIFEEEVIKKLFFWVLKTKRVTRENKTDVKITHKNKGGFMMEMNLIKGYVGSEIHETNINQEEIKMGKNVQTNVEAIIGKLEKSYEVFNNCKIGDSIDFEKLQINIPVLEYQGKKHQEKDWYVFRLSETLVKNGKVYGIRGNIIKILSSQVHFSV